MLEKQKEERRRSAFSRSFEHSEVIVGQTNAAKGNRKLFFKRKYFKWVTILCNDQRGYFRKSWYLFWRERKMTLEVRLNKNKSFKNGVRRRTA